jgi:hypothetical protein
LVFLLTLVNHFEKQGYIKKSKTMMLAVNATGVYDDIDEAMIKWITTARDKNLLLSVTIVN